MKENINKIDIEVIMENIRKEIQEKGYTNDVLSFIDVSRTVPEANKENRSFSYDDFASNLNIANQKYEVNYYRNIGGKSIKVFIKKVIRKSLSFLLMPVAKDQMEFNASLVRSMNEIDYFLREQKVKDENNVNTISILEEKLSESNIKIKELEEQLKGYKREY